MGSPRRLRLQQASHIYAMLLNAGITFFRDEKPLIFRVQGRVHAAADEEEPYGRVRMVAWLDAPSGEDPPADMVGKECLYPQLSLVLPLDRCSSCMEQGIGGDAGAPCL